MGVFKKQTKVPPEPTTPVYKFSRLFDRPEPEGLDTDDAEMRFWLPEAGRVALDEVTTFLDVTEAFWLRATFVSFLYGEHEYRRTFAQRVGFFGSQRFVSRKSASHGVLFSIAPRAEGEDDTRPTVRKIEIIPSLGKNVFPVKVLVPREIKRDMQEMADAEKETLSVFIRKLLLAKLLGQVIAPHPLSGMTAARIERADRWSEFEISSQEIPVDQKTDDDKEPEWL